MDTKIMKFLAGLVFALSAAMAQAAVIYTYTGNNYAVIDDDILASYPGTYDTSMSISGTITFNSKQQTWTPTYLCWVINGCP